MYRSAKFLARGVTSTFGCRAVTMPAPSAAEAFLKFLNARHEILRCHVALQTSSETFAKLSADCSAALVKSIVTFRICDDQDIADILAAVVNGPMADCDKTAVRWSTAVPPALAVRLV